MYPIHEPLQSGLLRVSDIHQIYWERSGNPNGKAVIFLHGGPGGGATAECRGFFDPDRYHIIIIDQRGCGRSLPYACIDDNTTWDLVADIEKVRNLLGIEQWQVFGGSWGSTLALAYAITHPQRVRELVLRGIFLCRPSELAWANQAGANAFFPEAWQDYLAPIPVHKRHDLISAYHELLCNPNTDETQCLQAARAWAQWESHIVHLHPNDEAVAVYNDAKAALAIARIENHYFAHRGWLSGEFALLNHVAKIRHIPTIIVQGRYDMCTPMHTAWELHQALPQSTLVVTIAGHSAFEPENKQALIAATDQFAA
ncbi:prolyl aminopeptidase [Snodgrassella sp. CFCC 13594]|uniref:prolyl aminopeptidase n=1 Tax=Snodgrassella sp. CFCC 13594 TaxID=1775559 RepID=UPI00082F0E3C|nr:prolyl aminopeptidase [Snodgrassella sp. CFCC 13594]